MDEEHEARLAELREKTQQARFEFVVSELAACFASARAAESALASGDRPEAEQEAEKAEKGYGLIVRFLPELEDDPLRAEAERNWHDLRKHLDGLQTILKETGD
jgi:hypothetical protein